MRFAATIITFCLVFLISANAMAIEKPRAFSPQVMKDVTYGPLPEQKMDVYLPRTGGDSNDTLRPMILMVHGGGWKRGDKAADNVVDNKVARWVPAGFVFVSINYPMLPEYNVTQQAEFVATAIAQAQRLAPQWHGDSDRVIIMGHSAGAHLISLLNAKPDSAYKFGARPWLGAISLDSAALDVEKIMNFRHLPLYDAAFGTDPAIWKALSPLAQMNETARPWLGVCSSNRDMSCYQADEFAKELRFKNVKADVIRQPLTHAQINAELGTSSPYTRGVESFMKSLDPVLAKTLENVTDRP